MSLGSLPSSRRSFTEVDALASYNDCLPVIADLLGSLAKQNSAVMTATPFDGAKVAPVSAKDYLVRICKYGYSSPEVFVLMVVFLDRLTANTGIEVTPLNLHRLILAAFVLAAKLRDDTYYSNRYYASIGGVSLQEMNALEQSFLTLSDWRLFVDEQEYATYVRNMRRRMDRKAKGRRDSAPRLSPSTTPLLASKLASDTPPPRHAPATAAPPTSARPQSRGRSMGGSVQPSSATLPPLRGGGGGTETPQERRRSGAAEDSTPTGSMDSSALRRSAGGCGGPLMPLSVP